MLKLNQGLLRMHSFENSFNELLWEQFQMELYFIRPLVSNTVLLTHCKHYKQLFCKLSVSGT